MSINEENKLTEQTTSISKQRLGVRRVLLIIFVILVVVVVMAYVAKIYLNKLAISSQPRYEQVCSLLVGKIAFGQTKRSREIDCISSIFLTTDGLRGCNRDDDCQGVCIRFIPADDVEYGYSLGMTGPSFSGSCSEGIRLLPKFSIRF